jgi:hypothetical protein
MRRFYVAYRPRMASIKDTPISDKAYVISVAEPKRHVLMRIAVACWREVERAGAKLCFVPTIPSASGGTNVNGYLPQSCPNGR